MAMASPILSVRPLPMGPMPTLDPFLFCVYHKDMYPKGNGNMEAPRRGNGQDFDPSEPYRMYHGETIPGFPQHPHRGFETVTSTLEGIIDHADSVGNCGRYGHGDVQWMTAGGGVVHSEMFPLLETERDNPLRLFQIWLNLPARNKMVAPGFAMFWSHTVPVWTSDDGRSTVTLWAGEGYFGVERNNAPPSDSWAADPANDVAIWYIQMQPGGRMTIPKAKLKTVNRSLFYVEGADHGMSVAGVPIRRQSVLHVNAGSDLELTYDDAPSSQPDGEFLLLQGRPIGEPVKQHGPFVMNTLGEIEQAFMDYQRTKFGGWPWPRDDFVFPASQKRFAKLNGKETAPDASDKAEM